MLEFLIQYWLEVLFGLVVAGLGFVCKKFYKMYKTEQKRQASKEQKELQYKLENLIKANTDKINEIKYELKQEIDIVKNGVLSVQKRNFEQQCHALLEEGHEITLAEFEQIQEEHKTYNSLGGNHDGDIIFEMVVHKANKNIIE